MRVMNIIVNMNTINMNALVNINIQHVYIVKRASPRLQRTWPTKRVYKCAFCGQATINKRSTELRGRLDVTERPHHRWNGREHSAPERSPRAPQSRSHPLERKNVVWSTSGRMFM